MPPKAMQEHAAGAMQEHVAGSYARTRGRRLCKNMRQEAMQDTCGRRLCKNMWQKAMQEHAAEGYARTLASGYARACGIRLWKNMRHEPMDEHAASGYGRTTSRKMSNSGETFCVLDPKICATPLRSKCMQYRAEISHQRPIREETVSGAMGLHLEVSGGSLGSLKLQRPWEASGAKKH